MGRRSYRPDTRHVALIRGTNLPLWQVHLFVADLFRQTLTNLAPAAGNALSVALNGSTAEYIVPADATLASVAAHMDDHDLFDLLAAGRSGL